jgi:5-methylcytosine-specific restriction endonuclease McrA
LKAALALHGGRCFYCEADGTELGAHLTLDHVDSKARGGQDLFHNLVVACLPCNRNKGALPVEAFRPDAARAWLLGVQAMIRARLALMQD